MKRTTKQHRFLFQFLFAAVLVFSLLTLAYASGEAGFSTEIEPEPPATIVDAGLYSYQINNDLTITIAEFRGDGAEIEIPLEIDGLKVSAIGYRAFYHMNIKDLVIPEQIREIGREAFEYCEIENLQLPPDITIQGDAFAYAWLPKQVTLPVGTTTGIETFAYCRNLEVLKIEPQCIIGKRTFNYSDDIKCVVCADGVRICDRAFEYCDNLEDVFLCGTVEIEEDPFDYCDKVKITEKDSADFDRLPDNQEGTDGDNKTSDETGVKSEKPGTSSEGTGLSPEDVLEILTRGSRN